jgi:hypothetical protein
MSIELVYPLGFRLDGRPIWGMSGAEGEDGGEGDGDGKDDDKDADGKDADEPKTEIERLRKSIAAEREATKAARTEARAYKVAMREAGVTSLEALKEILSTKGKGAGSASGDQQIDLAKITKEAESKATTQANRMIALAKVEARAAGIFEDPDDVVAYFRDQADDFVGDDGRPDVKHIDRELLVLADLKRHWVKKKEGGTDFELGARQTATGKPSMDNFLRSASRNKRG